MKLNWNFQGVGAGFQLKKTPLKGYGYCQEAITQSFHMFCTCESNFSVLYLFIFRRVFPARKHNVINF